MAHTQYKITAPVLNNPSGGDIQAVLGESSGRLDVLCKSSKINKWTKNKPFSAAFGGVPTYAQRQAAYFGLAVPIQAGTSAAYFNKLAWDCMRSVIQANVNKGGLWGYIKPSGGANSQYRQADFDGYNSMADIPISIGIQSADYIKDMGNHEYELAVQDSTTFVVSMNTTPVADINLWEFLQPTYNYDWNVPWRLRCELYTDDGSTPWYSRSAPISGKVFVSDALSWSSETEKITRTVTVNMSGLDTTKLYYLVIGLQRCDSSGGGMQPNGIMLPWTDSMKSSQLWPFLWKIRLANYATRTVKFANGDSTLGYATSSWFTYSGGYFTGAWRSGILYGVCTITRNSTATYFVGQNGSGYSSMIQFAVNCPAAHGETLYYATPSNPSRQTVPSAYITTGNKTDTTTLYMVFDGNVRPTNVPSGGGYYSFNIFYRTYTGGAWSSWVTATTVTLNIT